MNKMPYEVQFTETTLKNLKRYPKPDRRRILQNIEELAIPMSKAMLNGWLILMQLTGSEWVTIGCCLI